jgi:hypothetical protein
MARKLGAARVSPWRSHEEDDETEKENKKKMRLFFRLDLSFPGKYGSTGHAVCMRFNTEKKSPKVNFALHVCVVFT